jgi:hypothetical protein
MVVFTKVTAAKISDALDAFDALSINGAGIMSKAPQEVAQLEVQREAPQEPTDAELTVAEVERPAVQGPEVRTPEGKAASNPKAGKTPFVGSPVDSLNHDRRTRMLRVPAARGRQTRGRNPPAGRRMM